MGRRILKQEEIPDDAVEEENCFVSDFSIYKVGGEMSFEIDSFWQGEKNEMNVALGKGRHVEFRDGEIS